MDKYTAKGGQIYEETWVNPERAATLLNELAAAHARIADLERNGSHDRLRATQALVDAKDVMIANLRKTNAKPARIRFNVTAADFQAAWEHPNEQRTWPEFAMEYLAEHAVIDVPEDLVEALAKAIRQARMSHMGYALDWDETNLRTQKTYLAEARAAIAFLCPVTWQDVKKQMSDIRERVTPSMDDYSRLMDWLRANLPGGEE